MYHRQADIHRQPTYFLATISSSPQAALQKLWE